jgi:hypothetical protein
MATFVITLRAEGTDVRGLRLLLKRLWRWYGLKCVSVEESDDDRLRGADALPDTVSSRDAKAFLRS